MAERPFMQFYGSDFVGDTLHLSAEQIGAYMLLLIAMWNARGKLPNDDKKLARISRLSLHKWRHVWPDIAPLFITTDEDISHKRVKKEVERLDTFSQKARENGKRGGEAKALKMQQSGVARATNSPPLKPSIARATPEPEPDSKDIESFEAPLTPKRATRLPTDWEIPNEWGRWAVEEFGATPGQVRLEAARFKDHWIAKSGQNATKLDWLATWRNWCRGSSLVAKPQGRSSRPQSAAELLNQMMEGTENEQSLGAATPPQQHAITGPR